jgi:hypothetical protein
MLPEQTWEWVNRARKDDQEAIEVLYGLFTVIIRNPKEPSGGRCVILGMT